MRYFSLDSINLRKILMKFVIFAVYVYLHDYLYIKANHLLLALRKPKNFAKYPSHGERLSQEIRPT